VIAQDLSIRYDDFVGKKLIFLTFYSKKTLFFQFFFEKFGLYEKKIVSLQAVSCVLLCVRASARKNRIIINPSKII
jgi:hypothetical protein